MQEHINPYNICGINRERRHGWVAVKVLHAKRINHEYGSRRHGRFRGEYCGAASRIRSNVRKCCVGEIIYHTSRAPAVSLWTHHARRSGCEGWDGRDFSTSRDRKFVEDARNHGIARLFALAKHQLASYFVSLPLSTSPLLSLSLLATNAWGWPKDVTLLWLLTKSEKAWRLMPRSS